MSVAGSYISSVERKADPDPAAKIHFFSGPGDITAAGPGIGTGAPRPTCPLGGEDWQLLPSRFFFNIKAAKAAKAAKAV